MVMDVRIGVELCWVTLHRSFSLLLENTKNLTTFSAAAWGSALPELGGLELPAGGPKFLCFAPKLSKNAFLPM